MSDPQPLVSLRTEGRVGIVTLERPDSLNAISGALADDLTACLRRMSVNEEIWVVVLAAAGERAFSVGADLKERADFSRVDFYSNRERMRAMFAAVRGLPQPSIASVFGFAMGGGFELALSCDLIVASEDATFALPETRVGLLPAGGGTQLLTRRIGAGRAKELIFTGRRIGAQEAAAIGVVTHVVPRDQLEQMTMDLATDICSSSPIAVREAKHAINSALGIPVDEGIALENEAWRRVVETEDRVEGITAFNEKRDPEWKNR